MKILAKLIRNYRTIFIRNIFPSGEKSIRFGSINLKFIFVFFDR